MATSGMSAARPPVRFGPWGDGQGYGPCPYPKRAALRARPDEKGSGPIESVVEDRLEGMAEAGIRDELGVAQERHGRAEELDPGERIGLAREEQDRAADGRPVRRALGGALRTARGMERVAEQDERGIVRVGLGGGKAGDAAAVRLAADGDRVALGTECARPVGD